MDKVFIFNDVDVCINPNILSQKLRTWCWHIKTACFKNKWFFGYSYNFSDGGACSPCMHGSLDSYYTEAEAITAAARCILSAIPSSYSSYDIDLLKQYAHLCPVQLDLFDNE